jgi:hypothetical protein
MLMQTKRVIQIDLCQTLGADEDWDRRKVTGSKQKEPRIRERLGRIGVADQLLRCHFGREPWRGRMGFMIHIRGTLRKCQIPEHATLKLTPR